MRNEKVEGKRESHGVRGLLFPGRAGASSFLIPLVLGFGVFTACSSSPDACDYGGCLDGGADGVAVDGQSGDGSVDAKPDVDPPPPGCDTPNEPLKNPEKCLVDSFGAFVSPTGDDANPGTKAKPFKTIGAALGTSRSRIAVCEGEYVETLEIKRDVEIYSGITCTFDKAGGKATIKPEAATGLVVSAGSTSLFDVAVVAKAGAAPGESSIGIFAKAGTSLSLTRASVTAGAGADGKDPEATGDNHFANPAGNPAVGATGGAAKVCTCPLYGKSGGSAGGNGGDGADPKGSNGKNGSADPDATTQMGATGAGGSGAQSPVASCTPGTIGSPGAARLAGAGASRLGSVTASGWVSTPGDVGQAGNPGQGGGGGGGGYFNVSSAGGGGGGCGGCGGAPGNGGGGGGASIAVLALDSAVTVVGTSLVSGKGGNGKAGGTGQAGGGAGGGGGTGACSGGRGGAGAGGGGGGGGAGGLSVGIAYSGNPPQIDGQATAASDAKAGITVGEAGTAGGGGAGGAAVPAAIPPGAAGANGNPGAPGVAKAVVKVDKS